MTLSKDDLQSIQTLMQAAVQPLQEHLSSMQDDVTDIKLQLNQIDSNIIKTRRQILQEMKRVNDIMDAAFDDINRIDNKLEQHVNDSKHTA